MLLHGRTPGRLHQRRSEHAPTTPGNLIFGAASEPATIVDAGHVRGRDLDIELPPTPLEAVMSTDAWSQVYDRLAALIEAHRTTLVFVNTRRLAERAVEVDDVQPVRAALRELADELHRPLVEHRGARAIAGLEPHGAAAEQIDRRQELHAPSTKLRRMRRPTAWLFSGWNWTPSTRSSRWRTPITSPSGVRAVTSSSGGKHFSRITSEW